MTQIDPISVYQNIEVSWKSFPYDRSCSLLRFFSSNNADDYKASRILHGLVKNITIQVMSACIMRYIKVSCKQCTVSSVYETSKSYSRAEEKNIIHFFIHAYYYIITYYLKIWINKTIDLTITLNQSSNSKKVQIQCNIIHIFCDRLPYRLRLKSSGSMHVFQKIFG